MTMSEAEAADWLRIMGLYEAALGERAACAVCGTVYGLVGHGTDCDIQIVDYGNATATSCLDYGTECALHSKIDYRKGDW
ncbi:MAG: hypothetical protein OXF01_12310 [Gemmatimonadetes bacterium]|nr:hypothetical protein [Gemmatimonadota bacterium]